jgi:hypothetical protein
VIKYRLLSNTGVRLFTPTAIAAGTCTRALQCSCTHCLPRPGIWFASAVSAYSQALVRGCFSVFCSRHSLYPLPSLSLSPPPHILCHSSRTPCTWSGGSSWGWGCMLLKWIWRSNPLEIATSIRANIGRTLAPTHPSTTHHARIGCGTLVGALTLGLAPLECALKLCQKLCCLKHFALNAWPWPCAHTQKRECRAAKRWGGRGERERGGSIIVRVVVCSLKKGCAPRRSLSLQRFLI